MPTVQIDADYSAKFTFVSPSSYHKLPPDMLIGHNATSIVRSAARFSLSSIPAAGAVTVAELSMSVSDVIGGAGSRSVYVGGYGGSGQFNPESDSNISSFNRSDVISYGPYDTYSDFQTTGVKQVSLGASAISHIEGCRSAGVQFSVALQLDIEQIGGLNQIEFESSSAPTNKPKLIVTYSLDPTEASIPSIKKRKQLVQLLAG